jgi:hypothetical protein
MDAAERDRRREEIAGEIRARQEKTGYDSPFPAFLNVMTDHVASIESRLDGIEERLDRIFEGAYKRDRKDTDGGR